MNSATGAGTECVVCGSRDAPAYAPGPAGIALCRDCVTTPPLEGTVEQGSRCAFCRSTIGQRRGIGRRKEIHAGLAAGEVGVCESCLAFARKIVEA